MYVCMYVYAYARMTIDDGVVAVLDGVCMHACMHVCTRWSSGCIGWSMYECMYACMHTIDDGVLTVFDGVCMYVCMHACTYGD
jgi:hypothetical protein